MGGFQRLTIAELKLALYAGMVEIRDSDMPSLTISQLNETFSGAGAST